MRARSFIFAVTVTLAPVAIAAQACSSSDPEKAFLPTDASPDAVAIDVADAKDATVLGDAATCDLSADLTSSVPDASLADGATSTGLCLACGSAKCQSQISECNTDCGCQTAGAEALDCYLKNAQKSQLEVLQACGAGLLGLDSQTQQIALGLVGCMQQKCATECGLPSFTASDAGIDAANDADAN